MSAPSVEQDPEAEGNMTEGNSPMSSKPPPLGPPCVSTTFKQAIADPDSKMYRCEDGKTNRVAFLKYFLVVLVIASVFCVLSVGFWSELGCGSACLRHLRNVEAYSILCAGAGCMIFLSLYLLDFFCPPHLPGQYFALWDGDKCFGRFLLGLAIALLIASTYLIADTFPSVPLITSIFLSPFAVLLYRFATASQDVLLAAGDEGLGTPVNPDHTTSTPGLDVQNEQECEEGFERRMRALRRLTGNHLDQKTFYTAAGYAYALLGCTCVLVFVVWAVQSDSDVNAGVVATTAEQIAEQKHEKELKFIRWAAPLSCGIANFLFGLLMWIRVLLHRTYAGTDEVRNRLVVEAASMALSKEILKYRMEALGKAVVANEAVSEQAWAKMQSKVAEYLVQQCSSVQRLTGIIKVLNMVLLVTVGAVLLTLQYAVDSELAVFAQGFVGAFTIVFGTFIAVAFSRLRCQLRGWLQDLPLWRSGTAALSKSWARAAMFILVTPFAPVLLVLAGLNQQIRRCRGINRSPPTLFEKIFGRRAGQITNNMRTWEWLNVIWWCYIWCAAIILLKITPVFLNLLLAWMSEVMGDLNFTVIIVLTFAMGMFLFMLPPVPGPPIYLFGGIILADKCPWGFWWGTLSNVILGFVLKLSACAVQQKLIGGWLHSSMWVRQTCGVHTPLMRTIERVLQQPGFGLGKVMLLCGGPDWPTSVLAGILGASLLQCEIGTTPIVFAIIPLSLSGSFYQRKGEGEMWDRMTSFMFIITAIITMGFWAGAAWAVQDEFEKSQEAITMPREEFVDLEWLDYMSTKIYERCAVVWGDVPVWVLVPYIIGVVGLVAVANLFLWRTPECFSSIEPDAHFSQVTLYGESGIIRPLGLIGLMIAAACCIGFVFFKAWHLKRSREPTAKAVEEFAHEEATWKDNRRFQAREAARKKLGARTLEDISAAEVGNLRRRLTNGETGKIEDLTDEFDVDVDASTSLGQGSSGTLSAIAC